MRGCCLRSFAQGFLLRLHLVRRRIDPLGQRHHGVFYQPVPAGEITFADQPEILVEGPLPFRDCAASGGEGLASFFAAHQREQLIGISGRRLGELSEIGAIFFHRPEGVARGAGAQPAGIVRLRRIHLQHTPDSV